MKIIISYSSKDEEGKKYSEKLAEDLSKYGAEISADIANYRPSEWYGGLWFNTFSRIIPNHDYYVLIVTETFESSNAMEEFKAFRHCPNVCQGVCGKSKEYCNLRKIIPCFFISPSEAPESVRSITGIREFYTKGYIEGFMELLRAIFPSYKYASLTSADIGEIIRFCKELEEIIHELDSAINRLKYLVEKKYEKRVIKMVIDDIRCNFDKIRERYRISPEYIKAELPLSLLNEVENLINQCNENIASVSEIKLSSIDHTVKILNDIVKDLTKKLKEVRE